MKYYIVLFFIALNLISAILAKPFLFNTVKSLPQIAAKASSSATSKSVNIADYRAGKLEISTEESKPQNNDEFASNGDSIESNNEDDSKNEASPSFIQKKINKILAKIRFFSLLVNPNQNGDNSNTEPEIKIGLNGEGNEEDIDDFDFDSPKNSSIELSQLKKRGYGLYKAPNSKNEDLIASDSTNQEQHLEDGPGGLGVYFMELLGSFVGLIYGAAAHITNPTTPAITKAL